MAPTMTRLHITGASGSGTTTLGRALAARLGARHFDTDNYFWEPSDPPYTRPRAKDERLRMLVADLAVAADWILSGSLVRWGDPLLDRFDLIVFVLAPTEVRLQRLRQREAERYGTEAIGAGGPMHAQHQAFLAWAGRYDHGDESVRSRSLHESWLTGVPCPVLRVDGELATSTLVDRVVQHAARLSRGDSSP